MPYPYLLIARLLMSIGGDGTPAPKLVKVIDMAGAPIADIDQDCEVGKEDSLEVLQS